MGWEGRTGEEIIGVLKRSVLKEWDLASPCKNSIPCKHICYYLAGAAPSSAGCTPAPLWSQTAAFT